MAVNGSNEWENASVVLWNKKKEKEQTKKLDNRSLSLFSLVFVVNRYVLYYFSSSLTFSGRPHCMHNLKTTMFMSTETNMSLCGRSNRRLYIYIYVLIYSAACLATRQVLISINKQKVLLKIQNNNRESMHFVFFRKGQLK